MKHRLIRLSSGRFVKRDTLPVEWVTLDEVKRRPDAWQPVPLPPDTEDPDAWERWGEQLAHWLLDYKKYRAGTCHHCGEARASHEYEYAGLLLCNYCNPLRRLCPHPDKCGQEGCYGCDEPFTSRMAS